MSEVCETADKLSNDQHPESDTITSKFLYLVRYSTILLFLNKNNCEKYKSLDNWNFTVLLTIDVNK